MAILKANVEYNEFCLLMSLNRLMLTRNIFLVNISFFTDGLQYRMFPAYFFHFMMVLLLSYLIFLIFPFSVKINTLHDSSHCFHKACSALHDLV